MRVLHASNFGDKHNARLYWNQCFKISNGFIRNGHNVYNFSDRDRSRKSIINKLNSNKQVQGEFIKTIVNYNPELIILGHADRIHADTLEYIRKKNQDIKIIEWNVDNFHLDNTRKKLLKRSKYLDGIFSTTADPLISECVSNNFISFFPNIVDQSIENMQIFKKENHEYDVFFALSHGVGTSKLRNKNNLKEKHDPRVIFMKQLKNKSSNTKFRLFGMEGIHPVWANEFNNEISDCYMGICLQREPLLKYGLSDRLAQYAGNGLMVFIQYETMFNDLLIENHEAVYFNDENDLAKKINYFRDNKSKALNIAANGHKKLHTNCNERVVTKYFIDCLNNPSKRYLSQLYNWPINIYN